MAAEFRDWIESYGIEHRQAGGDPTALMKLSTDHKVGVLKVRELKEDVLTWILQGVTRRLPRLA